MHAFDVALEPKLAFVQFDSHVMRWRHHNHIHAIAARASDTLLDLPRRQVRLDILLGEQRREQDRPVPIAVRAVQADMLAPVDHFSERETG